MAWDKNGIWCGNVDAENGEWLVGNHLPDNHPGYISLDDSLGLLVKYWTASVHGASKKYVGPGHEPMLPAHDGRVETVDVLDGWFYCTRKGIDVCLGEREGEEFWKWKRSIQLDPDEHRRWFLGDSEHAEGVTLCIYEIPPAHFPLGKRNYESIILDTKSIPRNEWFLYCAGPVTQRRWSCGLAMIFQGQLLHYREGESSPCLLLGKLGYAFFLPDTGGIWMPSHHARTVIKLVYF